MNFIKENWIKVVGVGLFIIVIVFVYLLNTPHEENEDLVLQTIGNEYAITACEYLFGSADEFKACLEENNFSCEHGRDYICDQVLNYLENAHFYGSIEGGGVINLRHPSLEYINTSRSSWVKEAYYDSSNEYMVINLDGRLYQYCNIPNDTINEFSSASSHGSYYNSYIKEVYNCEPGFEPNYF